MVNLVLLRHGESYANVGKRCLDHQNLLTRNGLEHLTNQADKFKEDHPQLSFDTVFVSPLLRAQQTGFNFLSLLDHDAVDLTIVESLKERSFGHGDKEEYIKEHGQTAYDSWNKDVNIRPYTNGESFVDLYERVGDVYNNAVLPLLRDDKVVLIVSHYFVMQCLQARIEFDRVGQAPKFYPLNSTPYLYSIEDFV